MYTDIYKGQMQKAYLFGTAVLYSGKPIPREDVPQDWFSYELRGTVQFPDEPCALEDTASYNYAGSVLSPLPLKKGAAQSRLVKDKFELTAEHVRLADFCSEYHIPVPQTPIRHMLRPASPDEAGLFYALEPEEDEKLGAVGHVRIDFGHGGGEFRHSWWPRGPEELNTPEFREELGKVVDDLRKGVLKDLPSMRRYCYGHDGAIDGGSCCQNYGFVLETEHYTYRLRCNPVEGDYQAYLAAFDQRAQTMGHSQADAEPQIVGRISFANGEQFDYTDSQEYIAAIREELPYHPTTGFRYETLTSDPEVRRAVDAELYDLYGMEPPGAADNGQDMAMGDMSL